MMHGLATTWSMLGTASLQYLRTQDTPRAVSEGGQRRHRRRCPQMMRFVSAVPTRYHIATRGDLVSYDNVGTVRRSDLLPPYNRVGKSPRASLLRSGSADVIRLAPRYACS